MIYSTYLCPLLKCVMLEDLKLSEFQFYYLYHTDIDIYHMIDILLKDMMDRSLYELNSMLGIL